MERETGRKQTDFRLPGPGVRRPLTANSSPGASRADADATA
eukprot:CAMPEP_0206488428 /NCGR_PEP_ID=MMETSP0324_2-20121206/42407_1 /ASSEMBLY_ACC=CAM_ASM_000836 /TAXON_ID=2866 /ORGANISM="Crypthecodinium cohnii, Strain Seligo" /LENGTH=40 /DNA_ID= /DNA_START= /DNA_END= /DNA_ORIENTATION=